LCLSFLKLNAAELMQNLFPVGSGPSLNTWPKWELHFLHKTSVLFMSKDVSFLVLILPLIDLKKLGHPEPESYFASDLNNLLPQVAHA